ncbi:FAD-dependent oxidoreductase, partial [Chloroflexota bacterium]
DGRYVPLPAGLHKEWIDYIKSGKVPPLLGAAALVYSPPRFGGEGSGNSAVNSIGVFRHGKIREGQMYTGVHECWFDATSEEERSKALVYLRKMNEVFLNFLRERVPGFENAYAVSEGPMLLTRESRRIVGEHILTEHDILEARRFPDVIGICGYGGPVAHRVTGLWGDGVTSTLTKPFDIPFRCLLPKKIDNLLVAGRCISTNHLASGATREMAPCMVTGEAAGAAAALSTRLDVKPRNLDVRLLQKSLLDQGVVLFSEDEETRGKEMPTYVPSDRN